MVHLLLILKIIGIIVLSILGLALLILFFPITYVGKANGNIEEKKVTGNIRAGWLFHLLHCRLWIENTEIHYNIRLLGIKIKSSETKEKKKKEKRKNQSKEQSPKNEEKSQDELKENSVKETDIKQIGTSENEKEQEIQNSNLEETDVKNQNNENIKSEDSKKTTETNNRKKEKKSFITRMQIFFKKLKQRIKKIVENIKDKLDLLNDCILNVNIPNTKIKGSKITKLGQRNYDNAMVEKINPFGQKYYWIGGKLMELDQDEDSDIACVKDGYISITPINIEMTNLRKFELLKDIKMI